MLLHVANGHGTTGLIELSGVPGRTMVWCDPLYDGPVPGSVAPDELIRIRAAFLAGPGDSPADVAADLRYWRTAIARQDYDELVLWYEHDLFDQLNLIQVLTHIGGLRMTRPVSLVTADRFPGHPRFKGIGELTPSDVAALFVQRLPIGEPHIAAAGRAWDAFRADDPRAIEALLRSDTIVLPFLSRALRRHLEEFPSDVDGLSRSERRLMQLASAGATIRDAFPAMHDDETAFYITDMMFMDRAHDLASSSPPLLRLDITEPRADALPDGTLSLTPEGRDVLDGRVDRLPLTGLDRWLGGVHLFGRGPVWRWSQSAGTITLK